MDPESPSQIEGLLAAATIAHEAIFDLGRRLTEVGVAGAPTQALVDESARIAMIEMPGFATGARELRARWDEERVLDLPRAIQTRRELLREEKRIEPLMEASLDRLREIATAMRGLLVP
ncbi:MAG TPA: hypothetical protein VFM94_04170 [Solirubrobacterales bacterium]|nr:hypothetical protein [Solirubrobacterales bacterium]